MQVPDMIQSVPLLLLLLVLAACGGGEAGVPAEGQPEGPVVDLVVRSSGDVLLLEEDALWTSRDHGASWESIPVPEGAAREGFSSVAAPKQRPEEILLGGSFGVVRTEDRGGTWRTFDEGLSGSVAALAAHADSVHILFAYGASEGVFRSEDSGRSWQLMDGGPPGDLRALVHSNLPGSMNTGWLYAATESGVARAMDCFCGWRPSGELTDGAEAVSAVTVDLRRPERVYAGGAAGVFGSEDGGATWRLLSRPGHVTALATDGSSGTLFAATPDPMLLVSRDGGESWEPTG